MDDIVIYGFPVSTYVRSARLIFEEKSIAYRNEPVDFTLPDYRALHPWAKIPSLRHGALVLYETSAILRYGAEAFEGPSFVPETVLGRARMEQWISAINAYMDKTMTRAYIIERLAPKVLGRPSDEAAIAAALPEIDRQLGIIDESLARQAYLADEAISLADLLLAPILAYLRKLPDAAPLVAKHASVARWIEAMEARPAMAATDPEPPVETAA
ncbi:MAG: glutathione S-transferase family protein [Pseudomonadota bacterium]